jgi:hypothetical protein
MSVYKGQIGHQFETQQRPNLTPKIGHQFETQQRPNLTPKRTSVPFGENFSRKGFVPCQSPPLDL